MNFTSLNLIWNWKELIWLEKEKWHCCIWLCQQWHDPLGQGSGPDHFGLLSHEAAKQGRAPGFTGQRWLAKSWRLPALRCSGRGQGAGWLGGRANLGWQKGGGSPDGLGHGKVDHRRGKSDGKPEWRSSTLSERSERSSQYRRRLPQWNLARRRVAMGWHRWGPQWRMEWTTMTARTVDHWGWTLGRWGAVAAGLALGRCERCGRTEPPKSRVPHLARVYCWSS
jgi:hypothetical protein